MKKVYAPGCALMIYKPELAQKVLQYLNISLQNIDQYLTCCHHQPNLKEHTVIINTCAGCDRRYRELYEGISTISLWEVLAEDSSFPFPDYQGKKMTILDACPTRTETRVHTAIRTLLKKMNIALIEPEKTGITGTCCGDSFYGILPVEEVKEQMKKRAAQMPVEDVVVYCVSCCKSMHIGGKTPRYMVDLLFGEETFPKTYEPDAWHQEVNEFIEKSRTL